VKTYYVYLGTAEQFKYTMEARNLKALRARVEEQWSTFRGRWYRQPVDGCPKGAKRYIVKAHGARSPILIIPA
jgi:hypothetical protein